MMRKNVKKSYKPDKAQLRQIEHPSLRDRNKILDLFNKQLKEEGYIPAIVKYKQLMHELYKRHNSWMRPVYISQDNWFMH
jgi:hypothetical protein